MYRCYLSVYSPFFFSLPMRIQLCVWCPCVWGGWTKAMCLVCVLTRTGVWVFYKSREQQTIKCTKCALWVTDLPHHHHQQHSARLPKKSPVAALVSLGLRERTTRSDATELAQTVRRVSLCLDTKKYKISVSRGTGSTFDISQHERSSFTTQNLLNIRNDCLKSMCTVKKQQLVLPVYCILRLSFYSCAELPPLETL